MSDNKRKSHARISYTPLKTPVTTPDPTIDREEWLKNAISGFVSPSATNKKYYAVILRTLWPEGHGIPGPIVDGSAIRKAIDDCHGTPYHDPFRRVRELQGEEGFLGIIKGGNSYQLIDLSISGKRIPRAHLNNQDWKGILNKYGNVCAPAVAHRIKQVSSRTTKFHGSEAAAMILKTGSPSAMNAIISKVQLAETVTWTAGNAVGPIPKNINRLIFPGVSLPA